MADSHGSTNLDQIVSQDMMAYRSTKTGNTDLTKHSNLRPHSKEH